MYYSNNYKIYMKLFEKYVKLIEEEKRSFKDQ